jgi:hypothetical protein
MRHTPSCLAFATLAIGLAGPVPPGPGPSEWPLGEAFPRFEMAAPAAIAADRREDPGAYSTAGAAADDSGAPPRGVEVKTFGPYDDIRIANFVEGGLRGKGYEVVVLRGVWERTFTVTAIPPITNGAGPPEPFEVGTSGPYDDIRMARLIEEALRSRGYTVMVLRKPWQRAYSVHYFK